MHAAIAGSAKGVALLWQAGADLDATDQTGRTAIALAASEGAMPQFAQLYVHDPAEPAADEAARRYKQMRFPTSTSKAEAARIQAMLVELQTALRESNGYVRDFLTAAEVFEQDARRGDVTSAQFVINPDARPSDEHARKYDPPSGRRHTFQEVSVLIAETDKPDRSVVLRPRSRL